VPPIATFDLPAAVRHSDDRLITIFRALVTRHAFRHSGQRDCTAPPSHWSAVRPLRVRV
jgi:hypothetical protein